MRESRSLIPHDRKHHGMRRATGIDPFAEDLTELVDGNRRSER
jgi:hypothetical protein